MMQQNETLAAFLASLTADATATPVSVAVLAEMQEELNKAAIEEAKSQLRQIHEKAQYLVKQRRDLNRRDRDVKAALTRVNELAKKVIEGTLDLSDDGFYTQLSDAYTLKGMSIRV